MGWKKTVVFYSKCSTNYFSTQSVRWSYRQLKPLLHIFNNEHQSFELEHRGKTLLDMPDKMLKRKDSRGGSHMRTSTERRGCSVFSLKQTKMRKKSVKEDKNMLIEPTHWTYFRRNLSFRWRFVGSKSKLEGIICTIITNLVTHLHVPSYTLSLVRL